MLRERGPRPFGTTPSCVVSAISCGESRGGRAAATLGAAEGRNGAGYEIVVASGAASARSIHLMNCKNWTIWTQSGAGAVPDDRHRRVIFVQHLSENRAEPAVRSPLIHCLCGPFIYFVRVRRRGASPGRRARQRSLGKRQAPRLQGKCRVVRGSRGPFRVQAHSHGTLPRGS
jgi:hypothetical protein